MLALALLLPIPEVPVIPAASLAVEAQWRALAACPVVSVDRSTGETHGSGVVIGARDGFAYLLTAAHVVPFEGAGVVFSTRESWPKDAWRASEPTVVKKWEPEVDLALVRFKVGSQPVPVVPLAPPFRRPKAFPAPALSLGAVKGMAPTLEADTILAKRLVRSAKDSSQASFFWETRQPSRPGRSGGPLLDEEGRVIGICAATQGGRGYFVHHDEILAALKRDGGEFGWLVPTGRE